MKAPIIIPEKIKQFISGHLSDSLKPDELSVLKAWIDESPAHRKHFNEMRDAWTLAAKDHLHSADRDKTLFELADKVSRHNRRTQRGFATWQRIAASWVVLVIGAGALGWYLHGGHLTEADSGTPGAASTTIRAKMGSQSIVDMPDGTKVWLNAGSRLTYTGVYGQDNREVELTGEGCFEVVTDPEKPFVVKAGELSIKAFGTLFNVKAYPEDKTITTTLVKGKVTIEGKDDCNETFLLEMRPNEMVTYSTKRVATKERLQSASNRTNTATATSSIPEPLVIENNINPALYTSWKDDLWVIEKQKLGVLSKDLERRYNVHIGFSSEDVMGYHFSGAIRRETIEQVMKIMRRTIPLKYSFDKNLITIGEDQTLLKEFHSKNK